MIFYRRIPDLRNTPPHSMNLGFAVDSITDKIMQQQRELLDNIGMYSLTSPFNHNKNPEPDPMVKEEIDRKIRVPSRKPEDFFKID